MTILDALSAYLNACNNYADFPSARPDPMMLISATIDLGSTIMANVHHTHPEHYNAFTVTENARAVAARFIFDVYSDDDTDAPCDVEFDVHNLVLRLDPTHSIPEDVMPGHVIETVYDCACCDKEA